MAGDIIPVAPSFNIVRVARKNGSEYRAYSYRTFVASVFLDWGAERGVVYVAGGAVRVSVRRMRRWLRLLPRRGLTGSLASERVTRMVIPVPNGGVRVACSIRAQGAAGRCHGGAA